MRPPRKHNLRLRGMAGGTSPPAIRSFLSLSDDDAGSGSANRECHRGQLSEARTVHGEDADLVGLALVDPEGLARGTEAEVDGANSSLGRHRRVASQRQSTVRAH